MCTVAELCPTPGTFAGCVLFGLLCLPCKIGGAEQVMLRPCSTLIPEILWGWARGGMMAEKSLICGSNSSS